MWIQNTRPLLVSANGALPTQPTLLRWTLAYAQTILRYPTKKHTHTTITIITNNNNTTATARNKHIQRQSQIEKDQYRGRETEREREILCILERKAVCQDTRANQENDNHFDLLTVLWTSIYITMIEVVGELLFWRNIGHLVMSHISPDYSRSQLSVIFRASLGGLPSLAIQKVVV